MGFLLSTNTHYTAIKEKGLRDTHHEAPLRLQKQLQIAFYVIV